MTTTARLRFTRVETTLCDLQVGDLVYTIGGGRFRKYAVNARIITIDHDEYGQRRMRFAGDVHHLTFTDEALFGAAAVIRGETTP